MSKYGPERDMPINELLSDEQLYPQYKKTELSELEKQKRINDYWLPIVRRAIQEGVNLADLQSDINYDYKSEIESRFPRDAILSEETIRDTEEQPSTKFTELYNLIDVSDISKGWVVNVLKEKINKAYEGKEITADEVVALVRFLENRPLQTSEHEKDFRERQHND